MEEQEWTPTRKEFEVAENGKQMLKRITYEASRKKYIGFEKKELVDFVIRIIGLVAIFVPLYLFYLGQNSSLRNEKNKLQVDIYTTFSAKLHLLLKSPTNQRDYEDMKSKLLYELGPKLVMVGDQRITDRFYEIRDHLSLYTLIAASSIDADSLTAYYNDYNLFDEPFPAYMLSLSGKEFESYATGNRFDALNARARIAADSNRLKTYSLPTTAAMRRRISFTRAALDSIQAMDIAIGSIFVFKYQIENSRMAKTSDWAKRATHRKLP